MVKVMVNVNVTVTVTVDVNVDVDVDVDSLFSSLRNQVQAFGDTDEQHVSLAQMDMCFSALDGTTPEV